eukprot:411470_1
MAHVTDANSQDMQVAAQLMHETSKSYRTICLWFILCILWLLLTSFTLTGFVFAFYWDIMFRFSFIAFSWFITIVNLPFIIRPILKSFTLYHENMDQFNTKCVFCCNRFMHVIFLCLNIITTVLLIGDNQGKFWMACFFIGIHNVIFAFKFGTYLAMRSRASKFHGTHFVFQCLSVVTAIYINGNTEKGMLIFAPLIVWLIVWCIFVVRQSSMRRKQDEYYNLEKRQARHRARQKERVYPAHQQKVELGMIDIDVPSPSAPEMPHSPSSYEGNAAPRMLSLRINRDKQSEKDLMMLHEQQLQAINADSPDVVGRHRIQSIDSAYGDAPKEAVLRYKQARHVTCCCSKLICGLRTCLQIQTVVSAASIWGSFALFLLDKISWTCYLLMVFISATTIYNPICYTKHCHKIRQSKSCCTCDKCCLCCAYFFGVIVVLVAAVLCALLFVIANPFSVRHFDEMVNINMKEFTAYDLASAQTKLGVMYSVWAIAILAFFNYLPGAGWVFYQIPVGFPFINFMSFVLFLIVPMVLRNAFGAETDPCVNETFTCHIQHNSVNHLYNFLYNGYSERMESLNGQDKLLYIPHLTALIAFTIYVSLTGLGCSWYRFKKAIVESQAKLTGNAKGLESKDFGMTLIMAFTLTVAFGDVVSDAWYAFANDSWASPALKWLTISLFSMQIVIQVFSFNDVINQLRKSLAKQKSLPHCGCCYRYCYIFYWIFTLPYFIIVFMIGIVLGLTKLFSVKQVQEWWFKLLISGYGEEVEKAEEREKNVEICVNVEKELQDHLDAQVPPTISSMNAPRPMIEEAGHHNKESTQFEKTLQGFTSQSVRNFTADESNRNAVQGVDKWQSKSVRNFASIHDNPQNEADLVMQTKSLSLHKDNEPLQLAQNNYNVRDRAASGGRIHDVTTPKMAKFRAIYQDTKGDADAGDQVEAVVLEEDDPDKLDDDKTNKEERLANILDEDGAWLGYEVSSNSLLWKIYLFIDSFTPLWMSRLKVRANVYNSYFISELIIESWPQLVTNLVNSYYQGFSAISYVSASFSLLMISHTMLKIIYYVGVRNKNLDKFVL